MMCSLWAGSVGPRGVRARLNWGNLFRICRYRESAMTDLFQRTPESDKPGPTHNPEREVVWGRWEKKCTSVRALEGPYGDLHQSLLEQPRVYSSRDFAWKGGPQLYGKHVISPQAATVTQSIETHIEVYAPGAYGQ